MSGRAPFSNVTTSLEAAAALDPEGLAAKERVVLEAIANAYDRALVGLTGEEVCLATGLKAQTATARIRGLVLKGRLIDSGLVRRTSSGRSAIVWRLTRRGEVEPEKQTHGRIAAAVRATWERAAKWADDQARYAREGAEHADDQETLQDIEMRANLFEFVATQMRKRRDTLNHGEGSGA